MDLMKMNFISKPEGHTIEMVAQLRELGKELSVNQLRNILNDFWRLSKVGAWMIGIGNRSNLKPDLEKYLLTTPSDYSEHALINLYFLDLEYSGFKIFGFAERQIRYYTNQNEYIELDNLSIQWAIGILKYIDITFHQNNINKLESTELWNKFINKIQGMKASVQMMQMIKSEYYFQTIKETVKRIKN